MQTGPKKKKKKKKKSRGASPVRRREVGTKCEEVDGKMADKDVTSSHMERERTPDELRSSPTPNKMKIYKPWEQKHERSRSLPRKASLKSVKA
jgi:hypothetical protein